MQPIINQIKSEGILKKKSWKIQKFTLPIKSPPPSRSSIPGFDCSLARTHIFKHNLTPKTTYVVGHTPANVKRSLSSVSPSLGTEARMYYNVHPRLWLLGIQRGYLPLAERADRLSQNQISPFIGDRITAAAAAAGAAERQQVQGWLVKNNQLGGLSLGRELLLPFPPLAKLDRKSTVRR